MFIILFMLFVVNTKNYEVLKFLFQKCFDHI